MSGAERPDRASPGNGPGARRAASVLAAREEAGAARSSAGALGLLRRAGALLLFLPRAAGGFLVAAWMSGIAWLSSIPSKDLPAPPWASFVSNLAHAFLYGFLALWAALCLPRDAGWPRFRARAVAPILALVLAYALFDEWHQSRTPGRDPSLYDLITDVIGALSTLAVASYVGRRGAGERGLWLRLSAGAASCAFAALLATYGPPLGG